MYAIEVLGAQGGVGQNHDCVSFKIGPKIIIDAGNVIKPLGEQSTQIEHLFISHAHFDHIRDLPFLIESYYLQRNHPLKVYALADTIKSIKTHVFNQTIWPAFHQINHPTMQKPALKFIEIQADQAIHLGDFSLTPFATEHTPGSCGFVVEQDGHACIISSDTCISNNLSRVLQHTPQATTLFIETSFPNELDELAKNSQHLTPRLLAQQLASVQHPIDVYLYHLKPAYEQQIKQEITQTFSHQETLSKPYKIKGFLASGQTLKVFRKQPKVLNEGIHTEQCSAQQLASILKISQALSGEYQLEQLLDMVIDEAMAFTQADAGTLYRFDKTAETLQFTVVRNQQLDIQLGGTRSTLDWPDIPLYVQDQANTQMASALCALSKEPLLIDDVYENNDFDFSGTRDFDQKTGYRSRSMLVVPLLAKNRELLGVIQLINKTDADGEFVAFTQQDKNNLMALASQVGMLLSNALLINHMERLFESFAEAINVAFNSKCNFTGLHINQVAELAQIISQAIHQDQTQYAQVHYNSEMLYSIKLAALVHDIGKIATPDFVLHKATKLEKTIDRIDLIELRLMLVKQSLWLQALHPEHASLNQAAVPKEVLQAWQNIDNDFSFLQQMNSGKEFLLPEHQERINQLAQQHFDILGETRPMLNADEQHNLLIQRGTLTATEREQIMDHARLSLDMLSTLPFPEKYGKIVDIAANHHEKLNGKGYPRGLNASQLTLEDEILVLSDLYEALTSPHRPYKDPMKLSQVVNILCTMANQGEIDAGLVRFFFTSGTYKQFNCQLNPEQIDAFTLTLDNASQRH